MSLETRTVRIIGVPLDLGSDRRGVDMGPSAIRIAGLAPALSNIGVEVFDAGNAGVKILEEAHRGRRRHRYLREITLVSKRLIQKVVSFLAAGEFPLVLGGDHSIAAGSVSGVSSFYRRRGEKIGLIWVDAHTDFNTPETSPSGNVHGMPLAALTGLGPRALSELEDFSPKVAFENTVVIGARSIDPFEKENIRESGLKVFTIMDIDMLGMRRVMEEALERATHGTAGFHCSFDLDVVDPKLAPGVGTPVPGGISYREGHLAMEMMSDSGKLLSLEVVELNPVLDRENQTGVLAVDLVTSALGKKIL